MNDENENTNNVEKTNYKNNNIDNCQYALSQGPPTKKIWFQVEKPVETFTGRETFLEDLYVVIKESQDRGDDRITVLTQAPVSVAPAGAGAGRGGIGKTETVRLFIQLHQHEYDHIVWIDAENVLSAKFQFVELAKRLNISTDFGGKPKEFELVLQQIFEKLLQHAHLVLLIFDNAKVFEDDPAQNLNGIRCLLPKSLSPFFVEPTIIVTSRNQNWTPLKVIHLDLWTEDEVVLFVIRILELKRTSKNTALVNQLGALLGFLPIAIQFAVSVILQHSKRVDENYGIQNLIDEFESGSAKLLAQTPPFDASIKTTEPRIAMLVLWNISLEKIVKIPDGELAIKIICFMAYLSPTCVPQDFLFSLFQSNSSQDSFENAVAILADYSLIASLNSAASNSRTLTITIHRMIQDATIQNLEPTERTTATGAHPILNQKTFSNATEVLLKLSTESLKYIETFTNTNTNQHPRSWELVENLVQITSHVSKKLHVKEFRDLTEGTARFLRFTNNSRISLELFDRVLQATHASSIESEILDKIRLGRSLAIMYKDDGQVQKSLELYCQILDGETRTLGPHHVNTLVTKSNIASALDAQEKYDEAMGKFTEVLQGFHKNQDTGSKPFLTAKHNFALLLIHMGETEKALYLFTEVLKEWENDPDLNSRDIITTKSNIVHALQGQGRLNEASELMLETLEDSTEEFGPTHSSTLALKRKFADLLQQRGKHKLASQLLLELLEIQETQLGPTHPSTLLTKNSLACCYVQTSELDKALPLLDLKVREKIFGPEHPETMTTAFNLAFVMKKQGKFQNSLALFKEVCKMQKKVFGPNHPATLFTMQTIISVYSQMGEFRKAAKVAKDLALRRGREKVRGENNHPNPETVETLEMFPKCGKTVEEQNDLISGFMTLTSVDAEIGRRLLQASDWKLEVAVDTFLNCHSDEEEDISDSEEHQPLLP